ncbi:MAG: 4Fe-4S dicluster domain-containing protein [Chthoniobacterales bacterium]
MGASIALAGTTSCTRQPFEKIVPYLRQPEELVPGKPLYYATALTLGGYARGVLVETHEGRPTKIEGNPQHPATLGASDVFMQAELLTLYDPERSRAVTHKGQISTWDIFAGELTTAAQKWKAGGGAGLRLLTRHETSPTFFDQTARLLAKYPAAKWHEYEPLGSRDAEPVYHFDKAEVIVSLGADFLCDSATGIRNSRDFAAARRPNGTMCRLYVAEATPTLTGAMADHRMVMRPDEIEQFARHLQSGGGSSRLGQAIAADLRAHAGRSVVVAPPFLAAAARQLNDTLGNSGATVAYPPKQNGGGDLRELIDEMRAGAVGTLIIVGGNPAYDAPAEFDFAELLSKVPRTIHLGLYDNETAERCLWHVPETHELEEWSDARAIDGTITISQPMIEPLFAGRSRHELLSALLEEPPATDYDILRSFWQKQHSAADFEALWRKSLHDGVASFQPPLVNSVAPELAASPAPAPLTESGLHLLIRGDSRMYDGRYANNAWLQELPNPHTKIVWDNAALLSPATAKRFSLENGDVVNLKFRGRSVRAPIWIQPGQADDCVTVNLGYGRSRAGTVGNGVGFSAYALRTSDAQWGGSGLEVEKTGDHHDLVTTQHHWSMEGRDQVRVGTFAAFQQSPRDIVQTGEPPPSGDETLYPNVAYNGHAWGMAIDLNTCIGCGTCTIACQAENNIPVVGKEQVAMNREMHWIRVDRYYDGSLTNPQMLHQPVPCMHCENAPCELVCPVAATVHSSEGLNQMVYNRCIGTRYCSNNCPYKVRRFNFLEYDANQFEQPPTRKLMRNPDVTVRSRGVMEKCSYCIQRINAVKIDAGKANREIRDGEITPACAQACPADAIIFGDINDPNSRVAKLRKSPLNYGLLEELNTRPRTTYLAKLRNPNPEVGT